MAKFLKLTGSEDGESEGLIELTNSEEISNVFPEYEDVGGMFNTKLEVRGSRILMISGEETYVKETPEQIFQMIEGSADATR